MTDGRTSLFLGETACLPVRSPPTDASFRRTGCFGEGRALPFGNDFPGRTAIGRLLHFHASRYPCTPNTRRAGGRRGPHWPGRDLRRKRYHHPLSLEHQGSPFSGHQTLDELDGLDRAASVAIGADLVRPFLAHGSSSDDDKALVSDHRVFSSRRPLPPSPLRRSIFQEPFSRLPGSRPG